MNHIPPDYLERLYAGFLGKNIGIRLGAPVEPAIWTYERIRDIYGDITSYLKPYRNFAADDDANGPVYFIRPLIESDSLKPIPPQDIGRAWLDYSRENRGMFWWGGYGISTEHTAYLNLKAGIPAPESGSIRRNGQTTAEQIGGQIFVDTWGLVWPCRPAAAADYAASAASVSHDGEGLEGARFIAACIAAAFQGGPAAGLAPEEKSARMRSVIETGLSRVGSDSLYRKVADAVLDFHDHSPEDWRACMEYLIREWGYDRYPGLCHIIPNAGVCVLSLVYGAGDFARTVEIATMCGWDTDCNAGNVGTIAGVLGGLSSLPARYREPINDCIVLSGLPGSLNILDIPTFSRVLASIGYKLAGVHPPDSIRKALERGDGERAHYFDFALPGSTHGFRVSDPVPFSVAARRDKGNPEQGLLEFRYERVLREGRGKLFWKPFYRRADFDDERYSPVFSPLARSGQTVRIVFSRDRWEGDTVGVAGYVRDSFDGRDIETTPMTFPKVGEQRVLEFSIPDTSGSQVDEVGLILTGWSGAGKRDSGRLLIDSFSIEGPAHYTIDPAKQAVEFGSVTPFSHDGERWNIQGNRMHLMTDTPAFAYTGGYAVRDQRVRATVTPLAGLSHLLGVRAKGAMRSYLAGFDGYGKVSIIRRDFGLDRLDTADFPWEHDRDYDIQFSAVGDRLDLTVDGKTVLSCRDSRHGSGMLACGTLSPSRTLYGPFEVEEW